MADCRQCLFVEAMGVCMVDEKSSPQTGSLDGACEVQPVYISRLEEVRLELCWKALFGSRRRIEVLEMLLHLVELGFLSSTPFELLDQYALAVMYWMQTSHTFRKVSVEI